MKSGASTQNNFFKPADNLSGKKYSLDDFQILHTLGQGSFGTVKLIKHNETGQLFAIKCLVKANVAGRKQIEHIINERKILSKFQKNDFCCNIIESL